MKIKHKRDKETVKVKTIEPGGTFKRSGGHRAKYAYMRCDTGSHRNNEVCIVNLVTGKSWWICGNELVTKANYTAEEN
jgi:hypothetical protein